MLVEAIVSHVSKRRWRRNIRESDFSFMQTGKLDSEFGSNFISVSPGECGESFGKARIEGRMNLFSAGKMPSLKDSDKGSPYNIFEHQNVPKHELLSKRDAEELMRGFHIRPYQLPYLRLSDPAAQALGAKMGDIVKITRKSPTAGEVVVYRYVVEG